MCEMITISSVNKFDASHSWDFGGGREEESLPESSSLLRAGSVYSDANGSHSPGPVTPESSELEPGPRCPGS